MQLRLRSRTRLITAGIPPTPSCMGSLQGLEPPCLPPADQTGVRFRGVAPMRHRLASLALWSVTGNTSCTSDNFDHAFQAALEAMQAEVALLTDAKYWPPDLDTKFFMWVADGGTSPRVIGDPSDESGWLAQRDTGGSIRTDLYRLRQLEDGIISFIDAGRLLKLRLSEAGIEVTLDVYPGGHTTQQVARTRRLSNGSSH